ncbi:MAG: hypothetical protein JWP74_1771 [Marmoricola sp.]|nr:hypothetical protein [Marmoricola sp.]
MALQVRSDGLPLETLGNVVDVTWTENRDTNNGAGNGGGSRFQTLTFKIPTLAPDFTHPALMRGKFVELLDDGVPLGQGIMSEPDRSTWTFTATGLAQEMKKYTCHWLVSTVLTPTSVLDNAINYAISIGARFKLPPGGLRSTPLITIGAVTQGDDNVGKATIDAGIRTLEDLLNAVAKDAGKRWWVDEYGYIRIDADAVVGTIDPKWAMLPETAQMGVADDDFYTTLIGLYALTWANLPPYQTLTTATVMVEDAVAVARYGRRVKYIDFTNVHVSTSGTVGASLAARLAQTGARTGFTNRLELSAAVVDNLGGTPAYHYDLRPGEILRIRTIDDSAGNIDFGNYVDIVMNELTKTDKNESVLMAPMGLVVRDVASWVADVEADSSRLD